MNDVESRIEEGFDAIRLPESVRRSTLASIDAARTHTTEAAAPAKRRKSKGKGKGPKLALAACFALLLACFVGYQAFAVQTAFVDIDVNPSLELGINRMNTVVSATALNDDAADVLAETHVVGKPYQEAFDQIAAYLESTGTIDADSFVAVGVTGDDAAQAQALQALTEESLGKLPCEGACEHADDQVRIDAHAAGMGTEKYLVAQELLALDPNATLDECRDMSMKELRSRIAAAGETTTGAESGHGASASAGTGHGSSAGNGNGAHS